MLLFMYTLVAGIVDEDDLLEQLLRRTVDDAVKGS